jgi:type VI secretion system protein ImpG
MGASRDSLLEAYQRELTELRRRGGEFARRYPKIASRLELSAGQTADPHVERLIEAFAFLTARVQRNLDAELPEITTALLGVLYPFLVEPLPSLTIARFDVDPERGLPLAGHLIPRHTRLFTEAHSGERCGFRTCYPLTLWPVAVTEARLESPRRYGFLDRRREVASVLRLRLEGLGTELKALELSRLRFFLDGEQQVALGLYTLLTCHARGLTLLPDGDARRAFHLPAEKLVPVGFAPEEELLPRPPHAHRGYGLLREYFAFPEKYLFVDFELEPAAVRDSGSSMELLVLLDTVPDAAVTVTPESFRLGCTPIINLFPKVSEPIRLDHRRTEYPLVADHRRERTTEIHSVLSVSASTEPGEPEERVAPFFSFDHPADGERHQAFWYARRRPTGRADVPGTELLLSFLDLDFEPRQPATRTLFANVLCTNRELAAQLPPGAELQIEESAPLRGIRCLRSPTPEVPPPLGGPSLWRLISQLSLNHLSLAGPEGLDALRELLRLHGDVGDLSAEQQLRGLTGLSCREVVRRVGTDAWRGFCRGLELTLIVDESLYVGSSPVLLGSVLSRFFGLYTSINSFAELVLKSEQREGTWKRWPPMVGEEPIL